MAFPVMDALPKSLHSPRAALMVVFAGFGAAVGSWAGAIPLVIKTAGIDSYHLGLGITVSTIATVLTMALGGLIGRHVSNRSVLMIGMPALAVVTGALIMAPDARAFFVSIVAFGVLLGLMDLFMNAEASAIEHDMKRPIFTTFHGAASLSMAFFAILSSYLSNLFGPAILVGVQAAVLLFACVLVHASVPDRPRKTANLASPAPALPTRAPLVIMGVAVGLSIAVETAALLWSAKLLDEQAPSLAAISGLGAAFYGLCNALMRFGGDRLRARHGDVPLMLASIALAGVGFGLLGLSQNFALSTIAFAAVGMGLAMTCPCLFNMAADQMPANRASGLSFISLIAGPPRIVAPWAFGWIATTHTTSFAFGLCAGVLAVAFALVALLPRLLAAPVGPIASPGKGR